MDPDEGLARLERMAQRARERREAVEAEQRRKHAEVDRRRAIAELQKLQAEFLAGPPDGCVTCYVWARDGQYGPLGPGATWRWVHLPPGEILWEQVYRGEKPDDVLTCRHDCHGPAGYPRPIVLFA